MNIDLLCGHATMLHAGCKVCARKDIEQKLSVAREALKYAARYVDRYNKVHNEIFERCAEALKTIGESHE
jgi:hypothetical protein